MPDRSIPNTHAGSFSGRCVVVRDRQWRILFVPRAGVSMTSNNGWSVTSSRGAQLLPRFTTAVPGFHAHAADHIEVTVIDGLNTLQDVAWTNC